MGNTITSCCHAPCKGAASFKAAGLNLYGHKHVATNKSRSGKKKRIRFVDNESPQTKFESCLQDEGKLAPSKAGEAAASLSKASSAIINETDHAFTSCSESQMPFIEDVADINSLFIFENCIGDGKFSSVFLAHPRDDPKSSVAIKVISRDTFKHRILKEITLMKELCHESIIRFISAYKDSESFYIVTEYCEGGELFSKVSTQGGLDELEACEIMAKLLSAVKYLHDLNICHRDLKPENIVFKSKGSSYHIKLVDFGLSKQLQGKERMKKRFGTPYYLAPEVIEQDYGKEVDLWSLGVISFVLLCGYPPFLGENAEELFRNIYHVNYDFLDEDWSHISEEAKDFISLLLVKNPKSRLTIEEALSHPWIMSACTEDMITVKRDGDLNSHMSEVQCHHHHRLDENKRESLSKSAECTTIDSYEKCITKECEMRDICVM